MTMTSHGAIWASMNPMTKPRRPLNRMRARAKAPASAMIRENRTARQVTTSELRTNVQKCSASTAVPKCSNVMFVGNQTGSSAMMSPVGFSAVANIQYTGKMHATNTTRAVALGQTRPKSERFTTRPPLA
ncbi:hypothetical protein SALBM217S_01328 [Streptomyces griseoloalbus]